MILNSKGCHVFFHRFREDLGLRPHKPPRSDILSLADKRNITLEAVIHRTGNGRIPSRARNLAASVELINANIRVPDLACRSVFLFAHVQYENEVFSYNHQSLVQWECTSPQPGNPLLGKIQPLRARLPSPYEKSSALPYCNGYVYGSKSVSLNPGLGSPYSRECGCQAYLLVRPAKASHAAFAASGEYNVVVHNIPHVCLRNLSRDSGSSRSIFNSVTQCGIYQHPFYHEWRL